MNRWWKLRRYSRIVIAVSPPGVITNRDSLVIFNAEAAQYWEGILLHDWTGMAVQQIKN